MAIRTIRSKIRTHPYNTSRIKDKIDQTRKEKSNYYNIEF